MWNVLLCSCHRPSQECVCRTLWPTGRREFPIQTQYKHCQSHLKQRERDTSRLHHTLKITNQELEKLGIGTFKLNFRQIIWYQYFFKDTIPLDNILMMLLITFSIPIFGTSVSSTGTYIPECPWIMLITTKKGLTILTNESIFWWNIQSRNIDQSPAYYPKHSKHGPADNIELDATEFTVFRTAFATVARQTFNTICYFIMIFLIVKPKSTWTRVTLSASAGGFHSTNKLGLIWIFLYLHASSDVLVNLNVLVFSVYLFILLLWVIVFLK